MRNKVQSSTILVLGFNPLDKKDLNYEFLNLKYLPSVEQVKALKPDLLIVNFQSYKINYHPQLVELCENLKKLYNLPIILIQDENNITDLNDENIFENIWNTSFGINQATEEINTLLNKNSTEQESVDFSKSAFQENVFNNCLAPVNLEINYQYFSQLEISGNLFKVLNLSASQVGIFFAEIKTNQQNQLIQAFLAGHLLAEINTLYTEEKNILWSSNLLLSKLSDSLYSTNQALLAKIKAFYCVLDLSNHTIQYSSAGKLPPIIYDSNSQKINSLKSEIQSELGLINGFVYHEFKAELKAESNLLFFTENLTEKNIQNILQNNIQEINNTNNEYLVLNCKLNKDQEIHCLGDSFTEILPEIDNILQSLPSSVSQEIQSELEIALQELFFKAYTKVQRSRLLDFLNQESSDNQYKQLNLFANKGFKINWWTNNNKFDISIYLLEGNIPWSWNNKFSTEDLEGLSDLILFFDNIQINPNNREISMTRNFI